MADTEVILVQADRALSLGRIGHSGCCPLDLVDDLARLQLAARRCGWSIRVRHASPDLVVMLHDVGLQEVIRGQGPDGDRSR